MIGGYRGAPSLRGGHPRFIFTAAWPGRHNYASLGNGSRPFGMALLTIGFPALAVIVRPEPGFTTDELAYCVPNVT